MKPTRPAETDPPASQESSFACQIENHLLGHGENVFAIYFHACRIAVNGEYYASAAKVAAHFGIGINTVRRAWVTLCKLGLFEKQPGPSKLSTGLYRVVKEHSEWATAHPGQCRKRKAEQTEQPRKAKPVPIIPSNSEVKTGNLTNQTPAKHGPSDVRRTPPPDAVTLLLRTFAAVSDNRVPFHRPHLKQLAVLLGTYSQQELTDAFARYVDDLNLDDPRVRDYAAEHFLVNADSACNKAREEKEKRKQDKADRDATALRLQTEAEQERRERQQVLAVQPDFDPLAD